MDEARILEIDRNADVPNCSITEYALDREDPEGRFTLRTANLALPLEEAGAPVTTASDTPAGPR